MKVKWNRRQFIRSASLAPFCTAAALGLGPVCAVAVEGSAESGRAAGTGSLKVSLNAYSFSRLLNDPIKHRGPGVTLLELVDFCAKNKFDGFDPTGYFFPTYPAVPPDSYITDLKNRARDAGIGISGTGVRNNFTTSDKTVRTAAIQHIKEWVEVAAKLGAPVIRVFADTQMRSQTWETVAKGCTRDQVQEWIADALKQCAECGKKFGVRIGVQNHGDFLRTGAELLALVKAVGSEWCGPIIDTGYFKTTDPYADMALAAPQAVNWQIKQSPFGEDSEIPTDLVKLLHIIRSSGYHGYLPIETLSPKGKPYDPYTVVPAFLKQLRAAIEQTA